MCLAALFLLHMYTVKLIACEFLFATCYNWGTSYMVV